MDSILRDLKFSVRSLLKRPTLTLIAIFTLAIGIGANTAIFSCINALLLKPLPFPDPDRIVALWDTVPGQGVARNEVTVANYLDWRAQNKTFEHLGIYRWWSTNVTGADSPEHVQGFQVTPNFLDIVGVRPFMGRGDESRSIGRASLRVSRTDIPVCRTFSRSLLDGNKFVASR